VVVCPLAASRGSNCSLTQQWMAALVHCSIISSCQLAANSEIVKHFCLQVHLMQQALQQVPDFFFTVDIIGKMPHVKYLHNGRVLCCWQRSGFWWLTDMEVFDVTAAEYDVFKNLVSRWHGVVGRSILRSKRPHCAHNKHSLH